MSDSASALAFRINRTWIVHGGLPGKTEMFLHELGARDAEHLERVCERAVAAARKASAEKRDPKPDFYGTIFSFATEAQRDTFLRDHSWTRKRAAELAAGEAGDG